MIARQLHSPTHGDLHVLVIPGEYEHGRTWRAVLDPAPPRLAHLRAVDGTSEEQVLEALAREVERYDAQPYQPGRATGPGHDEAAPASGG